MGLAVSLGRPGFKLALGHMAREQLTWSCPGSVSSHVEWSCCDGDCYSLGVTVPPRAHRHHRALHSLTSSTAQIRIFLFGILGSIQPFQGQAGSCLLPTVGLSCDTETICASVIPNVCLWHLRPPSLYQHLPLGIQTCSGSS